MELYFSEDFLKKVKRHTETRAYLTIEAFIEDTVEARIEDWKKREGNYETDKDNAA